MSITEPEFVANIRDRTEPPTVLGDRMHACIGDPTCLHAALVEGGRCPVHADEQARWFLVRATRRPSRYALEGLT